MIKSIKDKNNDYEENSNFDNNGRDGGRGECPER
jgi:hypothetical protein